MENILSKKIKQNILNFGPISIAEFMQNILFDQESGYYIKENPFGAEGDFITAPEISQVFGEILAAYIIYYWQNIGKPQEFTIIELGPGRAELMSDVLRTLKTKAELYKILEVNLIELSPKLRKIQQEKLSVFDVKITHYEDISNLANKPSFILANEFFDALPITQYQYQDYNWHERKIALDKQRNFTFILEKNHHKINLELGSLEAKNNDIYEICYPALNMMEDIAKFLKLSKSAAIFIDYGYIEKQFGDSLQALKKHKYYDVFKSLGTADLTAHVDFSALAKIVNNNNLPCNLSTQREFFTMLGFRERSRALANNSNQHKQKKLQIAEDRILAKEQMGELFKVMLINA